MLNNKPALEDRELGILTGYHQKSIVQLLDPKLNKELLENDTYPGPSPPAPEILDKDAVPNFLVPVRNAGNEVDVPILLNVMAVALVLESVVDVAPSVPSKCNNKVEALAALAIVIGLINGFKLGIEKLMLSHPQVKTPQLIFYIN